MKNVTKHQNPSDNIFFFDWFLKQAFIGQLKSYVWEVGMKVEPNVFLRLTVRIIFAEMLKLF